MKGRISLVAVALAASTLAMPAVAQGVYKIGSAVGLTGYAASTDRGWRDGLDLAARYLNAKGGIDGHQVQLVIEDNQSNPQQAVVVYQKMMSNDHVQIFDSGCVSAGNFAAAGAVARAKVPMVLCSILPRRANEINWSFGFLPPPIFELEARMKYLKDHTNIRKVGVLNDPSPYAMIMAKLATMAAKTYGIQIVDHETYQQDDSDMSVQIGRIKAAGAGAIIKVGIGGSTVTVAKDIKQLGLKDMLLIAGLDDAGPYIEAGKVLGDHFLFAATSVQIPESVPAGAARVAVDTFMKLWKAKYGDRDANAGARAWDSMMVIDKAVTLAKSTDGAKVRDALEKIGDYQGVISAYHFSPKQHVGITKNPFVMGMVQDGKLVEVK